MNNNKISLNGLWRLINASGTIITEADVPGTVFEALISNKLIENPFYGLNEHKMEKIFNSDWYFEKKFDLNQEFLEYNHILLKFHGLDTIAQIILNDTLLGRSENMFIDYEFDVTNILKPKDNFLIVHFKSPTIYAKEMVEKHKVNLKTIEKFPGLPYIRKAQYSFGWDWGPSLPDMGIWKDVELFGYNDLRFDSILVETILNYNKDPTKLINSEQYSNLKVKSSRIRFKFHFDIKNSNITLKNIFLSCKLTSPDKSWFQVTDKHIEGELLTIDFDIQDPLLWWPHDLGNPYLYDLEFLLAQDFSRIQFFQVQAFL